ncbi:YkvA family protein [Saccharothrix coeruleofusca]|uniref:YkvA family protein n=1 Tax=Saccharothrix coeruleofusca TaxID=33919 RepID=UPI00166FEA44|nr:YkvA family protein [Saccharothrix coeruleofusca]MBP2337635.1 uncharacterized membrane protein YkvA (DUF1232 family) [Saccharothrix coeruleofusca]
MIFFGGFLAVLGLSTLVWRDAEVVGLPPAAVGVALLVLGAAGIALGLLRRARRRRARIAAGEPEPMGSVLDRARALPRMLRARKDYGLPATRVATWAFALVYLVSPVDVLPELLPVIGVTDDAGVLVWLLTSLSAAAGGYLRWESERRGHRARRP